MPSFSRKEAIALSPAKIRMEDSGYVTGGWGDSDVLRFFFGGGGWRVFLCCVLPREKEEYFLSFSEPLTPELLNCS